MFTLLVANSQWSTYCNSYEPLQDLEERTKSAQTHTSYQWWTIATRRSRRPHPRRNFDSLHRVSRRISMVRNSRLHTGSTGSFDMFALQSQL